MSGNPKTIVNKTPSDRVVRSLYRFDIENLAIRFS